MVFRPKKGSTRLQSGGKRKLSFEALEIRRLLAILQVTNTADSGLGSLRHAIEQANSTPEFDEIHFSLLGGGVQVISPTSGLPTIEAPVAIRGFTQNGSQRPTAEPESGIWRVELSGANVVSGIGISLGPTANGSIIEGIRFTQWESRAIDVRAGVSTIASNVLNGNGDAIVVSGVAAQGNQIQGNLIGVVEVDEVNRPFGAQAYVDADYQVKEQISGINLTQTPISVMPGFVDAKVGKGFLFDGTDDYVTVGNPESLNMDESFSFQSWIHPLQVYSWSSLIFSKDGEYQLTLFADRSLRYWVSGLADWVDSGVYVPLQQWTHVAMTFDSGVAKIYTNGVLRHTNTNLPSSIGDLYPSLNEFQIGNRDQDNYGFFGLMDEVAVYDREIFQSEVEFAYTEGTAGRDGLTATAPVSYWPGEGDFRDAVGNNHGFDRAPTFSSGISGQGFEFDGEIDYLSAGTFEKFRFSERMSFEAWILPKGLGSGVAAGYEGGIIVNKEGEYEIRRRQDGRLSYAFANASPGWAWIDTDVIALENQWTHIALTYDLGTVKLYANGQLVHTGNHAGLIGDAEPTHNELRIGGRQAGDQHFHGKIDQIGIYDRVLGSNEVLSSFTAGQVGGNGLAASSPIAAWLGEGNYNDSVGLSPLQEKGVAFGDGISKQAIEFNGTSDQLVLAPSDSLRFSSVLSLEAWINPAGVGTIVGDTVAVIASREGEYAIGRHVSGAICYAVNANSLGWVWNNSGFIAGIGTWTHLVMTYDGQEVALFANGVRVSSGAASGPINDYWPTLNELRIGGREAHLALFHGKIDGVAVYGRVLSPVEIASNYGYRGASFSSIGFNEGDGIRIENGASENIIGGDATLERNIIGGNWDSQARNAAGVRLAGAGTNRNIVTGNYIGVTADGRAPQPNEQGVVIEQGAANNQVGGVLQSQRNIISANYGEGILIQGEGTQGNRILNNWIGLDVSGQTPLGNRGHGVLVTGGATSNFVGGDQLGNANVVGGNAGDGIKVEGQSTTNNTLLRNIIGLDHLGERVLDEDLAFWMDGTSTLDEVVSGVRGTKDGRVDTFGRYGWFTPIGSVRVPHTSALTGLQEITLQVTTTGAGINGGGLHIQKGRYSDGYGSYGFIRPSGSAYLYFYVRVDGSVRFSDPYTYTNYYSDSPITFTGTFDGSGLRLFANGQLIGSTLNFPGEIHYESALSDDFIFGSSTEVSQTADDIRVLKRALSIEEVKAGPQVYSKTPLANQGNAISVINTSHNRVGADGLGSLIAGHRVAVYVSDSTEIDIASNVLGQNKNGTVALSNSDGVLVYGSSAVLLGGSLSRDGNWVASSDGTSIGIHNSTDVTASNNVVGLTHESGLDMARGVYGVFTTTSDRIQIGNSTAGNVIAGSNAIHVEASTIGSKKVRIQNNKIGLSATGNDIGYSTSVFRPTALSIGNNVLIGTDGDGNSDAREGNFVFGLSWLAGNDIVLAGNAFGTDATGSRLLGEGSTIQIAGGQRIRVGTDADGTSDSFERNVINAGPNSTGIHASSTSALTIAGNYIGTNSSATDRIGNLVGIRLLYCDFMIGGDTVGSGNIISGNQGDGIAIHATLTSTVTSWIRGNIIGLGVDGKTQIGNGDDGIELNNAPIRIHDNTISGNVGAAIEGFVYLASQITSNRIGTDVFGQNAAGNGLGIDIESAASLIGGISPDSANVIAYNKGPGIRLPSSYAIHSIGVNQFRSNEGLAIDVGTAGSQLNDQGDVDGQLNFPVISRTDIDEDTNTLIVEGFVGSGRTIQFYRAAPSSGANGQGEEWLFSATEGSLNDLWTGNASYGPVVNGVLVGEDTSSRFRFSIPLANLNIAVGDKITAYAMGSTSEFSPAFSVGVVQGNLAPVVDFQLDQHSVLATDLVTVSAKIIDEDSVRWTATIDYDNGLGPVPVTINELQQIEFTRLFTVPGSYDIALTVTDNGGQSTTVTQSLHVSNTSPSVYLDTLSLTESIAEGDRVRLSGSIQDPESVPGYQVWIDFGTGAPAVEAVVDQQTRMFVGEFVYPDDGSGIESAGMYNISIRVRDANGGDSTISPDGLVARVHNVTPSWLSLVTDPLVVVEGQELTLGGSFWDPGIGDRHSLTIVWGDASLPEHIDLEQGSRQFSGIRHRYPNSPTGQAQSYQVRVTLADDNDPIGVTREIPVQVVPVGPSNLSLQLSSTAITEGDALTLVGSFTDSAVTESHDVLIELGDGTSKTLRLSPGVFEIPVTLLEYKDNPISGSTFQIKVTVTDEAGLSTSALRTITVANAAPQLHGLALSNSSLREGDELTVTGSYRDVGLLDTHSILVNWSDGSLTEAEVDQESRTFTATHILRDDNPTGTPSDIAAISVTIFDNGGLSTSELAGNVLVENVAPTVVLANNPDLPSTATTLNLRATTADVGLGDSLSYRWRVYEGGGISPVLDIVTSSSTLSYLRNVSVFQHRVIVDVSDDDGGTSSDSLQVETLDNSSNILINPPQPILLPGVSRYLIQALGGDDIVDLSDWTIPVILDGGAGKDILSGGKNDDLILLYDGDDEGYGNEGADTFQLTFNSTLTVSDFSGANTLDMTPTPFGVTFDFAATSQAVPVVQDVGINSSEPNQHFAKINGSFGLLIATSHADRIVGRSETSIRGGAGNDVFSARANASNITFMGNADADTFENSVALGNIIFDGGADADTISNLDNGTLLEISFQGDDGLDILTNNGVIGTIVFDGGADSDFLSNTGTITDIVFDGGADADTFENHGTILSQITFDGGADADTFLNTSIGGEILFNGGADADTFTNLGTLGSIIFDGGADGDFLSNSGNVFEIQFDGGADADTLSNTSIIGSILFDGGADADTLSNLGTIDSIVFDGGADADTLLNSGAVEQIVFDGGADADTISNSAGAIISVLDFGGDRGDDRLIQRGTVETLTFRGGEDADLLLNSGTTDLILFDGGADADTLLNTSIAGEITFEAGADNDFFSNTGTILGNIDFNGDDGFDRFLNTGAIEIRLESTDWNAAGSRFENGLIRVLGGGGQDTFVNAGQIELSLTLPSNSTPQTFDTVGVIEFDGGADADTLMNFSSITISFDGDSDLDTFVNSSRIIFNTGNGDNVFANYGDIQRILSITQPGLLQSQPVLEIVGGSDADTLLNSGKILGEIDFNGDAGGDGVVNYGVMTGLNFTAGSGSDFLNNYGNLGEKIVFQGDGSILDEGNDVLINTTSVNEIDFIGLSGDDRLINSGNAIQSIYFRGDAGNDVLVNSGDKVLSVQLDGGAGDDLFINRGDEVVGVTVLGNTGRDTLINSGNLATSIRFFGASDSTTLDSEKNIFANFGNAVSRIEFWGGSNGNTLVQQGDRVSQVILHGEQGNDVVFNQGDEIGSISFYGEQGDDRLENHGHNISLIQFNGGAEEDSLVNTGWNVQEVRFSAGNGNDVLLNEGAFTNQIHYLGAEGDDMLVLAGANGSNTQFSGGEGKDLLLLRGAFLRNTAFYGGEGDDRLIASVQAAQAEDIRFYGESGDDTYQSSAPYWQQTHFSGGAGNDRYIDRGYRTTEAHIDGGDEVDTALIAANDASDVTLSAGTGDDIIQVTGNSILQLSIDGGDGNDSIEIFGDGFDSIHIIGGNGNDFFSNLGDRHQLIQFEGNEGDDRMQSHGSGIGIVEFASGNGKNTLLQSGSDIDAISVVGTGGHSIINYGSRIGSFSVQTSGAQDSIVSSGSQIERYELRLGDGTNSAMLRGDGLGAIFYDGGSGVDSLTIQATFSANATVNAAGHEGADTFVLFGNPSNVEFDGAGGNDRFTYGGSAGTVSFIGSAGDDLYEFVGNLSGSLSVIEPFEGAADTSRDELDFSGYVGGGINLDLTKTEPQNQTSSTDWSIRLSHGLGIEDVVGSSQVDVLRGNARDNVLKGERVFASPPASTAQRTRTQYVVLDFDSFTHEQDGEHVYTDAERSEITSRIETAYRSLSTAVQFDVRVVRSVDELPQQIYATNAFATIYFNRTPDFQRSGGLASEIDFGNRNLGGAASVQVNGLLGGTQLPPNRNEALLNSALEEATKQPVGLKPIATGRNFVALSAKIAIHELAHLLGLRHSDAFGPIGFGIHAPPGAQEFKPEFVGMQAAFETVDHLIGSPASIGTSRFNDLRPLEFGEREAIKLSIAFAELNQLELMESSAGHSSIASAQFVDLVGLDVPTTVMNGITRNSIYSVQSRFVSGRINLVQGKSESDYYAFEGMKGDLVSVELMSTIIAQARLWGLDTIDSIIRVYDTTGNLVPYHTGVAVNDDQFEPTDSLLLDIELPHSGTFFIEVDTFHVLADDPRRPLLTQQRVELEGRSSLSDVERNQLNRLIEILDDKDVGNYELLVYRFSHANRQYGTDEIQGREGVDKIDGGSDDDFSIKINIGDISNPVQGRSFVHQVGFVDRGGLVQRAFVDYGEGSGEVEHSVNVEDQVFELQHTYQAAGQKTLRIRITNDDGLESRVEINLPVQSGNQTPTDIQLSSNSITENLSTGTQVGVFSVVDSDQHSSYSLALVAGSGDADNSAFEIVGYQLRNRNTFDFETKNAYSIRVRATDPLGAFVEKSFVIAVTNLSEIQSVQIGDGRSQRSLVNIVSVYFDGLVDVLPNALQVQTKSGAQTVVTSVTATDVDGKTRVDLRFSGTLTRATSKALVDGNYVLLIDGDLILKRGTSSGVDANRDGVSGGDRAFGAVASDLFFAFYGDLDGDRDVDGNDNTAFRLSQNKKRGQAGYDEAADFEGDGDVDAFDFNAFRRNLNKQLGF